jgi:hypothetical protein
LQEASIVAQVPWNKTAKVEQTLSVESRLQASAVVMMFLVKTACGPLLVVFAPAPHVVGLK